MAGTTINEDNVVYKTLYKVINEHTDKVSLELVLEQGAGKEKHQAIKDVLVTLGLQDELDSQKMFEDFKSKLDEAYANLHVTPIAGVEEMIARLKENDIKVVLNTGYNSFVANSLLEKLHWEKGKNYDALITADDVENGRPEPDMIFKAMQLFGVEDPACVLKAGDSTIDIEEGKNANCGITVGVLSGAQTLEQLEQANSDYVLSSLAELDLVIDNI